MSDLIAVRPWPNGFLMHIATDRPDVREQMGPGNAVIRTRPLCRLRKSDGRPLSGSVLSDHMIVGGFKDPKPWRQAVKEQQPWASTCDECVKRASEREAKS